MNPRLAAALVVALAGGAGCQLVIGDITLPDETRDLAALEGRWRLYGLADGVGLDRRFTVDRRGGVGWGDDAVVAGRIRRDPETTTRYLFALDAPEGALVGRFDPAAGVGLFTERAGGVPVFAVMVREPTGAPTLPTGWAVTAGLTEAGLRFGAVSYLTPGTAGFVETRHPIDGAAPTERHLVVDVDPSDPTRRGLVPGDAMGGVRWLTPVGGGGWAMGVQRPPGVRDGAALVWGATAAALPVTPVVCYGAVHGGEGMASRVMTGTLGPTVRWSDGREATATAAAGGFRLAVEGGFFDRVGTLVLADGDGAVFGLLPAEPHDDPTAAFAVGWGFGLCLRVGEGEAGEAPVHDAGVVDAEAEADAGVVDAGAGDAGGYDDGADADGD